jgi:hypothetical protein
LDLLNNSDSSSYNPTSRGARSNMNMFGDAAVIAYYRAVCTTEAAFTQTDAIQTALAEIQKDLVGATIGPAGYETSEDYLNEVMTADINTSESMFLTVFCNKRGYY